MEKKFIYFLFLMCFAGNMFAPEQVTKLNKGYTAKFLKEELKRKTKF